jgi:hypothetical protein
MNRTPPSAIEAGRGPCRSGAAETSGEAAEPADRARDPDVIASQARDGSPEGGNATLPPCDGPFQEGNATFPVSDGPSETGNAILPLCDGLSETGKVAFPSW